MSERFIKFIPSEEAIYLLTKKGHAFRLLTIIAESARRYEGGPDGLHIGEAYIGGYENYDMSEQNYRTAKEILEIRGHILIVETCRTRKKSENGNTTISTKVKILSSNVYDINPETKMGVTTDFCKQIDLTQKSNDRSNDRFKQREIEAGNDRSNDRVTTDQRPTNDKQEQQERKECKEEQQPQPLKRGCVVFSCLSKINDPSIQDSDKEWLCSRYDEKTVSDAIDCINQEGFKPQSTVLKSLRAACKGAWKTNKPDKNDFSRNKILSEHLENKGHKYYIFVANHTSLEIVKGTNGPSEIVKYDQKHEYFRKEVETKAKVSLKVNDCA